MALKLCSPHFRVQILDKLFLKASRNVGSYFSSRSLKSYRLLVHSRIRKSHAKNSFLISKMNMRFIHVDSAVYGNIVPYNLSDIGEGIVEVVIKEWFIKPGDKISQFDPICEVQSDKASVTISSRYDGIVKKLHYDIDATAKVGAPLIDIEIEESEAGDSEKETGSGVKPNKVEESQIDGRNLEKVLATPAVRRLAQENKVDLQKLKGTGRNGRIMKEDILLYINGIKDGKTEEITAKPQAVSSAIPVEGQDLIREITGIRKHMLKTMNAAWEVPHFSYCDEVDATELVHMKAELKRISESKGVKVTFMPFFIKAASIALKKYPVLNSEVLENGEKIKIKYSHNIGIAIDSPHGLVVPNIKNVQELDIIDIAKELNRLQGAAAKGKLGLDDLNGGTFTLSNIGIIGGTYTKPLLVVPQVIIGGIGKVQVIPRFDRNKNLVEAHIFNISWAADHRVLDGATVARFSNLWKLLVENPQVVFNI